MFRLSCCSLCLVRSTGKRSFSVSQSKWKGWSTASRVATKPAVDDGSHQESEQFRSLETENADIRAKELNARSHGMKSQHAEDILQRIGSSAVPGAQATSSSNSIKYFPVTVAETVESVRIPQTNRPVTLLNASDPAVLEKAVKLDAKDLLKCYLGLSKSRLTGLVVVTAMAGYALAPAPFSVGPFLSLTLGTALTSAAANTVNQIVEVPYDAQMDRTKNRVLVRQKLSKEHAAVFAVISGVSGLTLLTIGANGLTAALGGLNLLLYTCVYTPLKRRTIANTWVGSVVGGIPPLMGWAACAGELSHGALLLGGILYAWQFPHFNALSWNLRNDYNKAGYKMMSVWNPELCRKTSLRYSLSLILMSSLAPVCNVTSWTFVIDSLPLNGYLAYLAYKFYQEGDSASSRKLFRFSLIHLPTLILLMMVSKQAYKDKTKECPVTEAINEVSSSLHILPPSPPIVFSSISTNNSQTATSNINIHNSTPENIPVFSNVSKSVNDAPVEQYKLS